MNETLTLGLLRRAAAGLPGAPRKIRVRIGEAMVDDARRLPNLISAEWFSKGGVPLAPNSVGLVESFHVVVDPSLASDAWVVEAREVVR